MSTLLAIWFSWALLNAPTDDPAAKSPEAAAPPTATAPADSANNPPRGGGARMRLREGQRRREGPPGPGPLRGDRPLRQGPPPGPEQPLSPRDVDDLMQFARENFPQIHDRLDRLRREKPREFQRIVHRVYARLGPLMELARENPQVAEKAIREHRLQMVIAGLVEQYRSAKTDEERARLKRDIEIRIRERFDLRQERIRAEIQTLRKRLDDQERQLSKREQNKDSLLRNEIDRALDGQPSPPADVPPNPPPADPEDKKK